MILWLFVVIVIILIYYVPFLKYTDIFNSELKIFSQNGEDGVTLKIVDFIFGIKPGYYVEFGVQDGSECITRVLREKRGWKGLLLDGSNENLELNMRKEFITKENITFLFEKYNVPLHINLLCVDIDYNDFHVLYEILKKYTCDIIVCEYNASHDPTQDKIVEYKSDYMWDGTNYFGASLKSFQILCKKYGYKLVYCDKMGVNCFFVKDCYQVESKDIRYIYKPPGYGENGHAKDSLNRLFVSSSEIIS